MWPVKSGSPIDGGNNQSLRLPGRRAAPVLVSGPAAVREIEAAGPDGAVHLYPQSTAVDSHGAAVPVVCLPASGSLFRLGRSRGTCTAIDALEVTTSWHFAVIVSDTTAPRFSGQPPDVSIDAFPSGGAILN